MNNTSCECGNNLIDFHTNAFVDVNGFPYLLADYISRNEFKQIDRSLINNEITVRSEESMRTLVDINVDDVGKNPDSSLTAIGNNTKLVNLVNMIKRNLPSMKGKLSIIRKGIIVRINYQLENHRTGHILRTMVEHCRIPIANYFVYINPMDINNNSVINNYSGFLTSTVNCYQQGNDQLILRITHIDLFYEMVNTCQCIHNQNNTVTPDDWTSVTPLYHFSNKNKDIILHGAEVYNPMAKTSLVHFRNVIVNRSFVVNPAHRLVFKFNIWRNDTTIVNNTKVIGDIMNVPITNPYYDYPQTGWGGYYPQPNNGYPDYETLLRMYKNRELVDYEQNSVINKLNTSVSELINAVKKLNGEGLSNNIIPSLPEKPDCDCTPKNPIDKLLQITNKLQEQINQLKQNPNTGNLTPLPDQDIEDIVNDTIIP